ncbi:MAG: hypothetical protein IJT31_06355 [Oscillibacter sp.]|nr:hypothetical protein [Oscillibacter sp.]
MAKTQYWWLNARPQWWDLLSFPVGHEESYSLYNDEGNERHVHRYFLEAKVGDIVIGYVTSAKKRQIPSNQIVAILRVSAEQDGEEIYFEKTEALKVPVTLEELRECVKLNNMPHFTSRNTIPQGAFHKLTESEYDCIMKLIRAKNP